jgi:hypothetical protein
MPTGDEPCIIYDGLLAKQDNIEYTFVLYNIAS